MSKLDVLPSPLRDWILVRKEKKSSGLILPDSAPDAHDFFAVKCGPDVETVSDGDRLMFMPQRAMSQIVKIDDDHALIPQGAIVAVFPETK